MIGKLPTRYKALGPVLLFSLSQLVRFGSVRQSVGLNETQHRLGHTSRLWNRETWATSLQASTPRKRSSERRSLRHDWEIAHQIQSSGTGLTIFPVSTRPICESVSQLVALNIGSDTLVDCETATPEKHVCRPQPLGRDRVNAGV